MTGFRRKKRRALPFVACAARYNDLVSVKNATWVLNEDVSDDTGFTIGNVVEAGTVLIPLSIVHCRGRFAVKCMSPSGIINVSSQTEVTRV